MAKNKTPHIANWGAGLTYNTQIYDFNAKSVNMSMYINYMLNRTIHIFKYDNLPETITPRVLELYLQTNGNVCITEVNGNLYAFTGGLGGEPDVYYMPTIYTVANPALAFSKNLKIGEDCIVIPNDSTYMGMLPMFKYYATLTVETDISFKRLLVNMRKLNVFSSNNDRTTESAREYLRKLEDGEDGIIAEQGLVDAFRVQPYNNPQRMLTDLIEFQQYNKASWFNFIGLNANYNMKRESLNSNETQLNDDMLYPLIDDMLEQRIKGIEAINAKYGTNITVSFASTWEENEVVKEAEVEMLENEVDSTEDAEKGETEDETEPDRDNESE